MAHGSRRVGSIDDSVWDEPIPPGRRPDPDRGRRRPRRRWLTTAGGVAAAGLLGAGLAMWSTGSRPGGDPHDHMYNMLSRTLRGALPPGTTDVRWAHRTPVRWVTACPEFSGATSGWLPVSMSLDFVDRAPPATIEHRLDGALSRHGWIRSDEVITPGQGENVHWTLAVKGGRPANAFAYAVPAGSDQWSLSARWRPPGPVGEPCA